MEDIRSRAWPRVGAMAHELPCGPDEAEQLISLLRSFDLRAVQLGVPLLEEVMAKRELMATWCAQLEAASLPILALGGYRNLIAPDATKRERNIAFLQRCLEMAPQFGTAVVATETGTYFGLTWNMALETGGVLVGEEVKIEMDLQAVSQEEITEQ